VHEAGTGGAPLIAVPSRTDQRSCAVECDVESELVTWNLSGESVRRYRARNRRSTFTGDRGQTSNRTPGHSLRRCAADAPTRGSPQPRGRLQDHPSHGRRGRAGVV